MRESDTTFLRSEQRPTYGSLPEPLVVVDLFSGAGGLTLGLAEAARLGGRGFRGALAVDFAADACAVYRANFPAATVRGVGVEQLFDGELGTPVSLVEQGLLDELELEGAGPVDWLVGGPPCQGHSDLNNHTRRRDPRNDFYERMARATEVLMPRVVLIENVPPVRNDAGRVVDRATVAIEKAGYTVADGVISMDRIGVAQRRRRHTVLGIHNDLGIDPWAILEGLETTEPRDVRWAIGDLLDVADGPLDVPSVMSAENRVRAEWLLSRPEEHDLPNPMRPVCHQGSHSYVSMYGQLRWDQPAQTITSGFGSMGQGRYLHPERARTLTPHEAARLQFFPDWFDFTADGTVTKRGSWATMIGNAVPPKLTMELGRLLLPHLRP